MDDWFGFQRGLVAVGLLAAVPGCPSKDEDTDTTTGNTTSTDGTAGETSGSSTGSTGAGSSGDTPTGSGTGSATDSGTTTDATTGDATTDATTGGSTTGGVEVPPVCKSYGAKIAECYNARYGAMTEQYCAMALMAYEAYGADCVKAYEDVLACLSALSCDVLTGDMPYCETESAALEPACT
jgi:hypothetical protein